MEQTNLNMKKNLSKRDKIIKLYKKGTTRYAIAKQLSTSYSYVFNLISKYELEETIKRLERQDLYKTQVKTPVKTQVQEKGKK